MGEAMTSRKKPIRKGASTSVTVGEKTCSVCGKTLKDSTEWVRSKDKVLCGACYQALLYPNRKGGSQEIVD
jgi:ribosomal protein S27E